MNKISVVALGPQQSGKTVYLGSLYKYWSAPKGIYKFFIESKDLNQGNRLRGLTDKLYSGDWPKPTEISEDEEFIFLCKVFGSKDSVLQVSYLDYTGERLKGNFADNDVFQSKIRAADCIFCIIDGHKVYSSLKTKKFNTQFVHNELDGILTEIINLISDEGDAAPKPIHLVVSKWDILSNNGISIVDVKNFLINHVDKFNTLLNVSEGKRRIIRLIPVSAVGFNFAKENEKTGKMEFLEDGRLEPFQVNVPFSLTLLDVIRTNLQDINSKKSERQDELREASKKSFFERVLGIGGSALKSLDSYESPLNAVLSRLGHTLNKTADKLQSTRVKPIEESLSELKSTGKNLEYILFTFEDIEREFETKFPNNQIV